LDKVAELKNKIDKIQFVVKEHNNVSINIDNINKNISKLSKINQCQFKLDKATNIQEQLKKVLDTINQYQQCMISENKINKELNKLNNILKENNINKIKDIQNYQIKLEKVQDYISNYNIIKSEGDSLFLNYSENNKSLKLLNKEKEEVINIMREKGIWCEKCDRPAIKREEHAKH